MGLKDLRKRLEEERRRENPLSLTDRELEILGPSTCQSEWCEVCQSRIAELKRKEGHE